VAPPGPLLGWFRNRGEIEGAIHQRNMRKGLWKIADKPPRAV